ncbi:MAG: 50S ribosome-binding GTPase [Oscillospiraceae bacterium]|nr:MAG: 50S ribosome-binding GTPase [Oscillospiraceae bacterium]
MLNSLVGQKITIVSPRSQTTRNCIRAIVNGEDYQLVFLDTPGIHKPQNKLGQYMMRAQREAQEGCDVIVAMVTADDRFGPTDEAMLEGLREAQCPCVAVINKMDAADPELLKACGAALKNIHSLKACTAFPHSRARGFRNCSVRL